MSQCTMLDECNRRFDALEKAIRERVTDAEVQNGLSSLEKEIYDLKGFIKHVSEITNEHSEALSRLDTALDFLKQQVTTLSTDQKANYDKLDNKLDKKIDKITWWIIGTMLTAIATLVAAIVK